jgi:ABC-type lipoprotein release transport system permease subunit
MPKELLTNQFTEIESLLSGSTHSTQENLIFDSGGKNISKKDFVCYLDTTVINLYSLSLVEGNIRTITHTENSAVMVESKAKKYGYDNPAQLIGKEIVDGSEIFRITGIIKDIPANTQIRYWNDSFLVFNRKKQNESIFNYGDGSKEYTVLLKKNVPVKNFKANLDSFLEKHPEHVGSEESPYVLKKITNYFEWSDYNIRVSVFLFIFGLLILLTAAFSFISFQVSMVFNRRKEYALRKINGINSRQLFVSLIIEFVLPFLLACGIAFVFTDYFSRAGQDFYYNLSYTELIANRLNIQLLEYAIGGIIVLLAICYILTKIIYKIKIEFLFFQGRSKSGKNTGRYILLFLQMAVLLVFLCATLIVSQQSSHTRNKLFTNLSAEERENTICVKCNFNELRGKRDILMKNIAESKYVDKQAYSMESVMFLWHTNSSDTIAECPGRTVKTFVISPDFFDFFHGKIIQGNLFNDADYTAVIVNRAFVDLFPEENIIGKSFNYSLWGQKETYHVVGVVDNLQIVMYDLKNKENIAATTPLFFRLYPPPPYWLDYYEIYVKPVKGNRKEAQDDLLRCIHEFVPESYDIEVISLEDKITETFSEENLISSVSSVFFIFSLLLGLISIYSSIMLSVEKRRKEVAIRKINGATIKDIMLLFSKTYIKLWTSVCVLVFPFVYIVADKWLQSYSDRVSLHIDMFIGIYLVILLLIIITIIFQIWKVAKLNPAEVIKKE